MSTNSIGDLFPQSWKKDLAKANFKIGAVLKLYCHIAQKEKRFILAGIKYNKQEVALVHINSEINNNVFPSQKLKDEHLLLTNTEDRTYIDKNCYANCSQLIPRNYEELYKLLENNPSIHLGEMSDTDFKLVRDKIVASKIIRRDLKKDFALFL